MARASTTMLCSDSSWLRVASVRPSLCLMPQTVSAYFAAANREAWGARAVCCGVGGGTIKPINLPGWKGISIDMEHILSGRAAGGLRGSATKTLFPSHWSESQIENAVRQAYRYGTRVTSQGTRVLVQGSHDGISMRMWVNTSSKTIETAYPV